MPIFLIILNYAGALVDKRINGAYGMDDRIAS